MASKIEFINLSHPSQISSSHLQRRAYSHAARVNHARAKLARKEVPHADDVAPVDPHPGDGEVAKSIVVRNRCLAETMPMCQTGAPDPVNHLASSRRDPFGCFVRPLSTLEHYLFDHCEFVCSWWLVVWRRDDIIFANSLNLDITIVTTQYGSKCVILRDASFDHHQLRMAWIQLAMSHVGLLSSTFLSTCRHLYEVYRRKEYVTLATRYRISCLHAIRGAIDRADCSARDSIIATIISLALDEVRNQPIRL